ncbi:MAG: cytochrome P450 [Gammaproteobacteria bacterium]|jgi:cytochrome P450|nr:cytochrome P450 [Gammaproteobacteria bacterium]MBT4494696.1 cytochrome P450 [Gammaproteobacteria bacterium]
MSEATKNTDSDLDPRIFDSEEFQQNPFPIYKQLRDHHPIYHDRFHNRWIVSRYWDVDGCFQNNENFDRAMYKPDGPYDFGSRHIFGPNILEYGNSGEHRRLRNIIAGQFVGQNLQDFLPVIDKIADEVIDKFLDEGEVEIVRQFSSQLPIRVISNMLGLPRENEDTFVEWYQLLIAGLGFGGEHMTRGLKARNDMWDYIDPMIKERSKNPGEDLLSRICVAELDGNRMTIEEIKGFVTLLLAAGGDTTDKAISNMWYHLLYTRPDQLNDVIEKPELWENVFTEMMRYDPVVHAQFRFTTKEIPIHNEVIPERAGVILYLGAGNRDERAFKDPDTFNIHRDDLHMGRENRSGRYKDGKNGHLGFGIGQHFCMGYAMARQESAIACGKLMERIRNPRAKFADHPGVTAPNIDSGGFRAPEELWMEFDK